MEHKSEGWLSHLAPDIVSHIHGNLLDSYAVALEGWRRGLTLRWHVKGSEKFGEMETWFVDRPGQLFSLSSQTKTHYFFRTRGDKVTNEAVQVGKDKEDTKRILSKAGVSVPQGRRFESDKSDEEIREYGQTAGYPLVVKPTDGSFGRGIVTNIQNDEELTDALIYVRQELNFKDIIVEQYIPGEEYRLYVVDDKVVGAIHRIPPNVTGDGKSTIRELIEEKNQERAKNPRLISCPIVSGYEVEVFIERDGLSLDSIPSAGRKVFLSEKSNVSLGGDPVDVLEILSEEAKNEAVKALDAIEGLKHGGVDLIIHPSKEPSESAIVLELNPTAQIGGILYPISGKARDIPSAIIDYYFPETSALSHKKPDIYFSLEEALFPLSNKTAEVTEVISITPGPLYTKKYVIRGKQEDYAYQQWMLKQAEGMSLFGSLQLEGETLEAVIAGFNQEELLRYDELLKESLEGDCIQEEVYNSSIKLGTQSLRSKDKLIAELHRIQGEAAKAKNERAVLQKKYLKMVNSRVWKSTEPIRRIGKFLKSKREI
ncbi:ATP-grasp domain-containing protein [Virgibacillus xinjiangensis]|uniref:ATP-grasp domain-containing protein n=1 Tax=Virgibacillus xinjiangensis TaxID=393090 RepID=A0ABV7CTX9_9BACI